MCHEGYKGADCDLLAHWCEVPNCNGHGQCNQFGDCDCDIGWKGIFCDKVFFKHLNIKQLQLKLINILLAIICIKEQIL